MVLERREVGDEGGVAQYLITHIHRLVEVYEILEIRIDEVHEDCE